MEVYSLNIEDIGGYDDFIKDFEKNVKDEYKMSANSMLENIFSEFTEDSKVNVFLDGEKTKSGNPMEFFFAPCIQYETLIDVCYIGFN